MELGKGLSPATALRSDELGAVLGALGPNGEPAARLAAVVALLTGGSSSDAQGGAFAGAPASMTNAFTSGLHNVLRGRPVNEAQRSTTVA